MIRYGLIGHPLGHSFSKAYFTEKFKKGLIDACYENFDLESIDQLPQLIAQHFDLKGFNVTIPYKEAILPYLDSLDSEAVTVGAVNTVKVMPDGKLKGFNTDMIGFEATLVSLQEKRPTLILGTGGASKAVQHVLNKNNIPFHLVSRDPKKGHFTYEMLTPEVIREHLMIINATPVGMAPNSNEMPLIPYDAITSRHLLFDLIYNPEETRFLCQGRLRGAQTINGTTMLHAQAEASWIIWSSCDLYSENL